MEKILGKNRNVLKMQVQDEAGTQIDAMYFGDVERFLEFFEEKYTKNAVDAMLRGQRSGMKAGIFNLLSGGSMRYGTKDRSDYHSELSVNYLKHLKK